jgi:hypothetical protein
LVGSPQLGIVAATPVDHTAFDAIDGLQRSWATRGYQVIRINIGKRLRQILLRVLDRWEERARSAERHILPNCASGAKWRTRHDSNV